MADHLLDEFSPVSKQEWLDKVVADLKGKPYEKLVRTSESGIPIQPIYTSEDLPEDVAQSFPGMNDLRRGDSYLMEVSQGGWLLCQDFGQTHFDHFEEFKQGIEAQPWNGRIGLRILLADGFRKAFDPSSEHVAAGGLVIHDWSDLEKVVIWAEEKEVLLYFELGDAAVDFLEAGFLGSVSGGLDLNPLNFFREGKPDESLLAELLPWCLNALKKLRENSNSSSFKLFTINLQELEFAGANATQQISFALAMATELADRLTGMGVEADEVFRRIAFQFPITTDFFGEMAKIRAFRLVWGRMLEAWNLPRHAGDYTYIIGVPAISNETVADPHVNLLRHTTQAMSAALGGCVTVSLPAYNAQFEVPNEDALRIARNIQLVLKEEAYLNKVIDPAGGAYFVESLTDQLAAKAWTSFQEIEAAGGWLAYLKADRLAPILAEGSRKRRTAISTGTKTILGTNHFPNEKEKVHHAAFLSKAKVENSAIFQRTRRLGAAWKISGSGWSGNRLALPYEALRIQMQALAQSDETINRALLLTFGDPLMRAARANFSRNVLASGGFVCTENQHSIDLEASVTFAKELQPSVVVLCGGDADYLATGAEWLNAIRGARPQAILLLAGKPEGWEKLKENGISEPLFAGMDRVAFLQKLLEKLTERKEGRP